MLTQMILIPVFVLVALTFAMLYWTGRDTSIAGGPGSNKADGGFNSHHTLFYVLVALAIPLRHADLIMVLLAWVFVAIQLFRAGLFVSARDAQGSSFFAAGALVLLAMWIYFAFRILFPI